ncbi:MAG: DedA family protein [Verrucomicrobia bacterium]|nr:DedA family protein [Verrucomicrobiota bacterium]
MEKLLEFVHNHAHHAHWLIFGSALLAGLNIPISIDLLMILSAILAATIIPANLLKLFFGIFLGCLFSAWIAYWVGRTLGPALQKVPFFSKILSQKKIDKVKKFYEKKGFFALIIGRFIPFGVRNGLFMSSGISHISFFKFALWDGVACALWSSICFFLYYTLGKNIDALYARVKIANLFIFLAFCVTVMAFIWYKKRKTTKKEENV